MIKSGYNDRSKSKSKSKNVLETVLSTIANSVFVLAFDLSRGFNLRYLFAFTSSSLQEQLVMTKFYISVENVNLDDSRRITNTPKDGGNT